MNPLFPDDSSEKENDRSYLLPHAHGRRVEPVSAKDGAAANPAVELIRHKIDALYANEPSARKEIAAAKLTHAPRSKHQQKMYELTTSGKSLADIQTAWHNYYLHLSDNEKRAVWQEFYSANAKHATPQAAHHQPAAAHHPLVAPAELKLGDSIVGDGGHQLAHTAQPAQKSDRRTFASIKKRVLHHVRTNSKAKTKAKQHLQSLAFGIGFGALMLLIFLFGLFNERVIAPFIKPSSSVSATPIILPADSIAPSESPELIIPKLNVQLPVIYGGQSLAESDVQKALEDGVFHYPTTAVPGQKGNAAYFGHSSNNIFNKGRFKFAFVRLNELEPGDIFYLTYEKKVYTYKVYSKRVVEPEETWVLGPVEGKTATAALITCDPPGTTRHRLVVWGEQITPDPNSNSAEAAPSPTLQTQVLPDNGPSIWSRFWRWVTPW